MSTSHPALPFFFACPICQTPLEASPSGDLRCPLDGNLYQQVDGIWRFLTEESQANFHRFIQDYETIRQAEGRGSSTSDYYRALPFADLSGLRKQDWQIRARSFQVLIDKVIRPLERRQSNQLNILDLGAGNCWLSYRLAQRNHHLAAVDLLVNAQDGLGTYIHYDAAFTPVQAEYDHLPFLDGQADLIIFNASLHYSTDYKITLSEALRVLRPEGQLVILDSPVYRDARSGEEMVQERQVLFKRQYGFASNALPSENYLTERRLVELTEELKVGWKVITPFYGLRWALRPWKASLLRRREPARFLILVGEQC